MFGSNKNDHFEKLESNCKLCENSMWHVHNSSVFKGDPEKRVIDYL